MSAREEELQAMLTAADAAVALAEAEVSRIEAALEFHEASFAGRGTRQDQCDSRTDAGKGSV